MGSATPTIHCLIASGQCTVQLLQCIISLPGGSGERKFCNATPHCLRALVSAIATMHCLTAQGKWAVLFLQYTASLPVGSGQWNSCKTLPHCLGAVGSGRRRRRRRSAYRSPMDDGPWCRPPGIPRRPATGVLRLTSARARRISPQTSDALPSRHGPICPQIPVTNRLKVLDPPQSASQNRPAREGVGLPGASPPA